ncbi:MAG: family 16 glycoside hydrolase [Planctomycetota bacterium]
MRNTIVLHNPTSQRPILFAIRLFRVNLLYVILAAVSLFFAGCGRMSGPCPRESNEPEVTSNAPKEKAASSRGVITTETSLFDGKALGDWAITDFGGQGEVVVKDGAIHMPIGQDMTGITWKGPLIRMDYEITLEAMRTAGSDFFCGLTFPYGETCCSLVLGGWGGGLCGLSNIDYYDAANNQTTQMRSFESNKWYHVRLRITPDKMEAWLDEEVLVNINVKGRHIDVRMEMDLCQPLGIATWQTAGAVRNIVMKPVTGGALLPDEEIF